MNKKEAYQAMLDGYKIRHENYSPDEFAFINNNGLIQLEDGVVAGSEDDEFWTIYQAWNEGWETCGFRPMPHVEAMVRPGINELGMAIMGMGTPARTLIGLPDPFNNPPYLITRPPRDLGPEIFCEKSNNPIPKREYKDYTQRKPKPVKRKKHPKTFGKNKKK